MTSRRQGGWTLLELIVVVMLVVFLFVAAFEHLLPLRGAAERVAVESTVGALRAGLGLQAAQRVLKGGGLDAIWALEREDPTTWLAAPPPGYRQRAAGDPPSRPGEWYYDPARRELVYVLRFPEYVFRADSSDRELRWRVARLATPGLKGTRVGIDLVPTVAYAWVPRAGASEVLAWIERSR